MSEISRSSPTAPKPAITPANRSPGAKPTEERGDAFSALLSQVAETRSEPAGETSAGESGAQSDEPEADAEKPAKDGSDNPVAQVLGWADSRSTTDRASATATAVNAQAKPEATAASANAAVAVKADGAGIDITGMQPLATPQAIDPAALPPGANTAASRPAGTAASALGDARDARTSIARRDAKISATVDTTTVGLRTPPTTWQPLTSASARGTAAAGGIDPMRGRGTAWGNSTVSLDLSTAREADSMAGNAVSLTARLSALLTGQAQPDGAAPTPLLGATQEAGASPAELPSPADLLASAEAAPELEPEQVSHWSAQHLRHAHLRLGEGALDSVDIRLSMQGQDLSVDFRTDNADIRQSLAQQANQSLAALLERSGIALADVSVGAQQQQRQPQGQGGEPQRGGAGAQAGRGAAGRVEADASVPTPLSASQTLRADGSRPLDLFV
jgi:flagellar hook-length control protein FliK